MPGRRKRAPDSRSQAPWKVLIMSCSGGAGHVRAAEALHRTAPLTGLPLQTIHHDILDLTSPLFKHLYSGSYLSMVNHTPEFWGFLYQHSERSPYRRQGLIKAFDRINYRGYLGVLREERPDAIICTHFLPYLSVSTELRPAGIHAPVFAVTTDFDIHTLWIDPVVDRYSVFHEESTWTLRSRGISPDRIHIAGIPVQPEFRERITPANARRALGLPERSFTVLALFGGFGVGRVQDVVRSILHSLESRKNARYTLVAVCGKNERARTDVSQIPVPPHIRLEALGFVRNVHTLMDAADLLVSKSGGLTSSEALAKGLPMLIVDPIPGQESRNADLLMEQGAGWKATSLSALSFKLSQLLDDPTRIRTAAAAARKLGRPHAAEAILHDVVEVLQRTRGTPCEYR